MDSEFMKDKGYSQEEKYFFEKNKKLIQERRNALDQQRDKTLEENKKKAFWMICPKCGSDMKEENLMGIFIDQCSGCNGIYFDNGELETMLKASDHGGLFSSIKKLFNIS
jgi:hypothetical protein